MSRRETLEALSGLLLVLFVAMISATIVSVALPQIVGSLNGTQAQYTWVVTASLLASTATTPIWGKLADLFSKKLLIQIAVVFFMLGSLACGLAQSTGQLIGFRVIQGLGMGALQVLVQVVIAAMISPKERGRYNGYLGAVMAVATVAGPLLGGLIADTSWLGWRWCFFIAVPFCIAAFLLLSKTLHIADVRRTDVKIDYLGATLIAAGVSLLLIWVTFVDNDFDWISWQTGAMVGGSLVLLALAVWVESRVPAPIVPLRIIVRRTPALSILASLAVGMAMFGGAVFLGQYFQIGRGYTPTEAGLLTIPMMAGVLFSSTISGRMISKSGVVKPYIITGLVVLTLGFAGLSTLDHETPLWFVMLAMAAVGIGVGMSMQNLMLVLQNTVPLHELGAASGALTFFRSLGGTIGVSVLGAILANRVATGIAEGLAKMGIKPSASSGRSSLNLEALPEPIKLIVRAAYGDATGHIFLVSIGIALLGLIAALFLPRVRLRDTLDLAPAADDDAGTAPAATARADAN
ncbi:MDR family MFS transporter [Thermopolyspora sp. NPDC052614]|uniref:MDR family MFS transporter n=1 Tax=Thermopolyspora sp. NPDC052614 TaxID=3155682 RepID=UPI003425ED36